MAPKLQKGDRVFRVVPTLDDRGYIVQARTLRVASDKQLRLDSYFSFGMGLIAWFERATGQARDRAVALGLLDARGDRS